MAKSTKKAAPKKAAAKLRVSKEDAARIQLEQTAAATTADPQTGQSVVHDETPSKAAIKQKQAAAETMFAEADKKGGVSSEEIVDTNLRMAARGF